jgi:hypothetical protein
MSRSGRENEPSPLEIVIQNFATIAPWLLQLAIAVFMYFIFGYFSEIQIKGNPLAHPVAMFLVPLYGFMKIFVPVILIIAAIMSGLK